MSEQTRHRCAAIARKATTVCLVTLLIGVVLVAWIFDRGGPEALGAIIPMGIVGLVHLVGVPVAMLNAVRSGDARTLLYVFGYFIAFVVASLQFGPQEILVFHIYVLAITGLVFIVHYTKVWLHRHRTRDDRPSP